MKNVFIDSNIWLSLYHFSNDDLEQFGKLQELLGQGVTLFLPQQVIEEVGRNRENKIKDALNKFEFPKIQFPAFCKGYKNYENFRQFFVALQDQYKTWLQLIKDDIEKQTLVADKAIRNFFQNEKTTILEVNNELIEKAVNRYHIGNPPGKGNKYGDAINWECLLKFVPDKEDLYFISADQDYLSVLNTDKMNAYLVKEWENKKQAKIFFYKNLISFLNENISEIKLQQETEKEELIKGLQNSPNFTTTHSIIKELSYYTDWENDQIIELCTAAVNNTQVFWILYDEDVYNFYKNLLTSATPEVLADLCVNGINEKINNR